MGSCEEKASHERRVQTARQHLGHEVLRNLLEQFHRSAARHQDLTEGQEEYPDSRFKVLAQVLAFLFQLLPQHRLRSSLTIDLAAALVGRRTKFRR
eukprot:767265-Hanusia_phi.AAC.2